MINQYYHSFILNFLYSFSKKKFKKNAGNIAVKYTKKLMLMGCSKKGSNDGQNKT